MFKRTKYRHNDPIELRPGASLSKYSTAAGFSLVEVLVSIVILSLALTAIVGLFTINISSANVIKNNYMASALAQEGVEVARNLRDSDWHAGRAFGSFGNTGGVMADGSYRVQWDSAQLMPFLDIFLKKDSVNGIFSYDTGGDTIFKRKIDLLTVSAFEKRLVVTVSWDQKGSSKTVVVEEHLFNWK